MIAFDETIEELVDRLFNCSEVDTYVGLVQEICTRPGLVMQLIPTLRKCGVAMDIGDRLIQTQQVDLFVRVFAWIRHYRYIFASAAYVYGRLDKFVHILYPGKDAYQDFVKDDDNDFYDDDEFRDWVKRVLISKDAI